MHTFVNRHIGPTEHEVKQMLDVIGAASVDDLMNQIVPTAIRLKNELKLNDALSEQELLQHLHQMALKNKMYRSFIGYGYYGTFTPTVILRNIDGKSGLVHAVHTIPGGNLTGQA